MWCGSECLSRIEKNMQPGSTPHHKGKCGRKRISSQQDDRALVRLSKANRKITLRRLMIEMNTSGVQMSSRTVQRLIETSLRAYRPRKKPKLIVAMMKKWLSWAKQFATSTEEDRKRVSCLNVLITLTLYSTMILSNLISVKQIKLNYTCKLKWIKYGNISALTNKI